MTESDTMSFDDLWKSVQDTPVQQDAAGQADEALDAGALTGWLGRIADGCRDGGLVTGADHAELQGAIGVLAERLGKVPPAEFRAIAARATEGDPQGGDPEP